MEREPFEDDQLTHSVAARRAHDQQLYQQFRVQQDIMSAADLDYNQENEDGAENEEQ